jgi:hypothetical protein
MYVNAKLIAVETSGIGGGVMKENSGVGESSIMYLIRYKKLCICYHAQQ